MLCSNQTVIQDGESVALDIDWHDRLNMPEAPMTVDYRVFDYATEAAVSPLTSVTPVAATMAFIVPPEHLPASTAKRRRLVVQVRGEFPGGEIVIETVRVDVERVLAFS